METDMSIWFSKEDHTDFICEEIEIVYPGKFFDCIYVFLYFFYCFRVWVAVGYLEGFNVEQGWLGKAFRSF